MPPLRPPVHSHLISPHYQNNENAREITEATELMDYKSVKANRN